MNDQCPGQLKLPLWPALHPCPVCETDRLALGHHLERLTCPYSMEDLIQHVASCSGPDKGIYGDEVFAPSDWPDPF